MYEAQGNIFLNTLFFYFDDTFPSVLNIHDT